MITIRSIKEKEILDSSLKILEKKYSLKGIETPDLAVNKLKDLNFTFDDISNRGCSTTRKSLLKNLEDDEHPNKLNVEQIRETRAGISSNKNYFQDLVNRDS